MIHHPTHPQTWTLLHQHLPLQLHPHPHSHGLSPDPDQLLTLPPSSLTVLGALSSPSGPDQAQLADGATAGSILDPVQQQPQQPQGSGAALHSPVSLPTADRRITKSMSLYPATSSDQPVLPTVPSLYPHQDMPISAFFIVHDDIPIPKTYEAAMAK